MGDSRRLQEQHQQQQLRQFTYHPGQQQPQQYQQHQQQNYPQQQQHHQNLYDTAGSASSSSHPCKCSQCDPNYYSIPLHLLFNGKVDYVCRDCQFSTLSYQTVQEHESATGHRRWYNYPQQ